MQFDEEMEVERPLFYSRQGFTRMIVSVRIRQIRGLSRNGGLENLWSVSGFGEVGT